MRSCREARYRYFKYADIIMPEIGSGNSETTEVEVRLQSETIAQPLLSKLNETGDVVFSSKPSGLDRPQPLTPPRSGEGASGAGPETLPSQLGGQDRTHTAQLSFFFGKEGDLPTFVLRVKNPAGNVVERKYKMNTPIVKRVG